MPQESATSTKKYQPEFVLIPQRLLIRLAVKKAPPCAIYIIQVLLAYSFGKDSCFPSHQTIQTWIGGKEAIGLSTIRKGLKWLEDHGFIKRNHRRSKDRYLLFVDRPKKQKKYSDQNDQNVIKKDPLEHPNDQQSSKNSFQQQKNRGGEQESSLQRSKISQMIKKDPESAPTVNPEASKEQERHPEHDPSATANSTQKSKPKENEATSISPMQAQEVQYKDQEDSSVYVNPWRPKTQRRRSKEERAFAKAEKKRQEERARKEHSTWERRQRLETLILGITLFKEMPPYEFQSDLNHIEGYAKDFLDMASPEKITLLKIGDKQAFLRLIRHLVWEEKYKK